MLTAAALAVLTLPVLGAIPSPSAWARSAALPPATLSFYSEPALHPPAVRVTNDPDLDSGDIFLTPFHSYQAGPMILNGQGQLIWFDPVDSWTTNLEVQHYLGEPVLTWWQGRTPASGPEDVIVNRAYQTVAILKGHGGYLPDLHEFQITPQGTALIDAIGTVNNYPLTEGGHQVNGSVDNNVIQEINIHTGQVVWQWSSLRHVPVSASYQTVPRSGAYDYFHLNSIQQLPGRRLLVSARDTSAIYLIDERTGDIIWTLGGKQSSFKIGTGAAFAWQHDAHLVGQTLTLFDDNWGGPGYPQTTPSSAMTLHLDTSTMTATLVRRYAHTPAVTSEAEGNTETLPNNNVFVGWGNEPDFSEYTPNGSQIFNGNFAIGVKSYRAYRFQWVGRPATAPALAVVAPSDRKVTLYASWNGATGIAAWRILGGLSPLALYHLDRVSRTGFETSVTLHSPLPYFAVQALDSAGQVLGTSAAQAR